jgi:hypothetical protein
VALHRTPDPFPPFDSLLDMSQRLEFSKQKGETKNVDQGDETSEVEPRSAA